MLTSQKAILSFIVALVLFSIFTISAFTGLFDLIETRFYSPSINAQTASENNRNAKVIEKFFKTLQDQLSETLKTDAVRRSLLPDQVNEDYLALNEAFSHVKGSFDGIQWVRFIDSGGIKLHFSTYTPDIINYNYQTPFYRNYDEPDLPYSMIEVENGGTAKCNVDSKSGQILFSFPLYDSFDVYCGTALFSLSMDSVLDKLLNEGRMVPGKAIMLITNPPGMVFGNLAAGETLMPDQISSAWKTGKLRAARLSSPDSGVNFILISTKTSQDLFIGSIIREESYLFPRDIKFILLISFFLTMYLTIFLLFSIKQEPVTIIQNRLKQLQISILEQFYELKSDRDWNRWIKEMEHRRGEINALLKQGIRPPSGNLGEEIDTIINKSWDELLSVLGNRMEPGFDEKKLRSAINSMLAALPKAGKDLFPGGEKTSIKGEAGKGKAKKAGTGLLGRASAIVKEIEEADLVEEIDEEELKSLQKPGNLQAKQIATERPAPELADSKLVSPSVDLAALASQIEFSPGPEPETNEGDSIGHDLEIVSPFPAILDSFNEPSNADKGNVIKEKEGLPFISAEALNLDESEKDFINIDFKSLVDSVIKN